MVCFLICVFHQLVFVLQNVFFPLVFPIRKYNLECFFHMCLPNSLSLYFCCIVQLFCFVQPFYFQCCFSCLSKHTHQSSPHKQHVHTSTRKPHHRRSAARRDFTSWRSDCGVSLDSAANVRVPAERPQYTRAHIGGEAVGGSPAQHPHGTTVQRETHSSNFFNEDSE